LWSPVRARQSRSPKRSERARFPLTSPGNRALSLPSVASGCGSVGKRLVYAAPRGRDGTGTDCDVRYFLDTQLYSYTANGTIPAERWRAALAARDLRLSPFTAYELVEGLLHSSAHTSALSLAAIQEALVLRDRIVPAELIDPDSSRAWMEACSGAEPDLPGSFFEFRARADEGRAKMLARLRGFMAGVMPHYRRLGDPLFSPEWREAAGRALGENLDAAFVFETSLLDRAMRIRYHLEKHPSDYLDCLQLGLLNDETLAFVSADRKLVRAVSRSLQSDRIYLWEEFAERT
jgi:hypothetical protein